MDTRFNRILLGLLGLLYLGSLAAFTYANWRVEEPDHVILFHALNALILSVPLILFYGSLYVLIRAWGEHRRGGQIQPRLAKVIHWAPRAASIAIIFFISLFSFDVFEGSASLLQMLLAFLMHSLPSIFLILMLALAWKRPLVGFAAFLLVGLFFLRFVLFPFNLGHFLLFSGPLLLISALYYADWRWLSPSAPAASV